MEIEESLTPGILEEEGEEEDEDDEMVLKEIATSTTPGN